MRRRFLALFALGMVGIVFLPLDVVAMLRHAPPPDLPPGAWKPPFSAVVVLSLVTPTLLLALGVWAGCKCARAVGLVSFVDERRSIREFAPLGSPRQPHILQAPIHRLQPAPATELSKSCCRSAGVVSLPARRTEIV